MEEEILKIINHKFYDYRKGEGKIGSTGQFKMQTAKEITSHVFEFIEWLLKDCPFLIGESALGNIIATDWETNTTYKLPELYQYWKDNVKDK